VAPSRAPVQGLGWAFLLTLLAGCAAPPAGQTVDLPTPDRATFAPVGEVLGTHCGTMDCHGAPERNLRVYGIYGERLGDDMVPGNGSTTEEELTATWQSLVAIDPERLAAIVVDRGRSAEEWIVVTKGRGAERHKGGARLRAGSPGDRCLLSWLAGAVDPAACAEASATLPPGGEEW